MRAFSGKVRASVNLPHCPKLRKELQANPKKYLVNRRRYISGLHCCHTWKCDLLGRVSGWKSKGGGLQTCVPYRAWWNSLKWLSLLPRHTGNINRPSSRRQELCLRIWRSGLINQQDITQAPKHKLTLLFCNLSSMSGWQRGEISMCVSGLVLVLERVTYTTCSLTASLWTLFKNPSMKSQNHRVDLLEDFSGGSFMVTSCSSQEAPPGLCLMQKVC